MRLLPTSMRGPTYQANVMLYNTAHMDRRMYSTEHMDAAPERPHRFIIQCAWTRRRNGFVTVDALAAHVHARSDLSG